MSMNSTITSCVRGTLGQFLWALAMGLTAAGGILLLALMHGAPLALRIAAVALPLVCGGVYIHYLVRDMRRLDELQLRIHLEAAATACLGVFIAAIVFPVVQMAGFVRRLEAYYVVFLLVGLVMFGYLNASRRYR
jgi:hypothetical protein